MEEDDDDEEAPLEIGVPSSLGASFRPAEGVEGRERERFSTRDSISKRERGWECVKREERTSKQ